MGHRPDGVAEIGSVGLPSVTLPSVAESGVLASARTDTGNL